jgi:hypothetical protein
MFLNFRVLETGLSEDVSGVGIEAMSKLRNLRHFDCSFDNYVAERDLKCLLLCAQHLPWLHIVGSDFLPVLESDFFGKLCYPNSFTYHDELAKQPFTLGLRQLMLDTNDETVFTVPHNEFLLPDLQALHLSGPRNDVIDLCNRYSTVTNLALYHIKADQVIKILQGVGGRLTRLWLTPIKGKLSLSKILQLCPNLVQFQIHHLRCSDWDTHLPKDVSLGSLEEVSLHVAHNHFAPHHIIIKVSTKNILPNNSILHLQKPFSCWALQS